MTKVKMNLNNVTVIFAKEEDNKSTVSVAISETQRAKIMEKIAAEFGEEALEKAKWTPVKDSEKNGLYVKSSTNYPVSFYEDGKESDGLSSVEQVGKNALIDINISIGESKFRREKGFTAFLSAVNVHEFGDTEKYNPFTDDAE